MVSFKPIKKEFWIDGLYSAFRFDWDESFVFAGESHNFWEIVFVESGAVEVTEDENIYTLFDGNLIFHAPMEFHRIKSYGGSSPKGFILSFSALGELPEMISGGVFTLDPTQKMEYVRIAQRAVEFNTHPCKAMLGQEVASLLSAFIVGLGAKDTVSDTSKSQGAIEYRRIVSYMNSSIRENLTLTDIANKTNVSVSYIKQLFKTYAGISPKSFFNQMRIRHANELLKSGLSATQVSELMRFSSPSYFSAFYKKHTGLTPSEHKD